MSNNFYEIYPEKWIWSHKDYPNFRFKLENFLDKIKTLEKIEKTLNKLVLELSNENITKIKTDILCDEIINTSIIEGEVLQRKSVSSSIRKKLDENFNAFADKHSTKKSDNLVAIFLDANSFQGTLRLERLFGWHNALFNGNSFNGLYKMKLADFRDEPIQVVSGVIGKEKIHYEGVPVKQIREDMDKLLEFYNTSDLHSYIKSAIVHFWFVAIHPFDDGNGRLARILADSLLPKNHSDMFAKFYTISTTINKDKKAYYDILEHTSNKNLNPNLEIDNFIKWHLDTLEKSFKTSIKIIENIIIKTNFWDKFKTYNFNERQKKVINKILANDCKQQLDANKYKKMSKSTIEIATNDIKELLNFGCLIEKNGKINLKINNSNN